MKNQQELKSVAALIRGSSRYWAAEYSIAVKYFKSGIRNAETDAKWLGFQMFKEWTGSGVYGEEGITVSRLIDKISSQISVMSDPPKLDNLIDLERQLSFASDEFRHFRDLARAYYHVVPESTATLKVLGDLQHGYGLSSLRHRFRKNRLGQVAVDLSEGGGLGLYFGIRNAFSGCHLTTQLDKYIFGIGRNTLADEMGHMAGRYTDAARAGYTSEEWTYLDKALQEICWQKLLERNQQFSSPYTESGLNAEIADQDKANRFVVKHLSFLLKHLEISSDEFS